MPRNPKDRMLEQLREATLGEYEILLELGSGGMATVYLAHDLMLDRKVAIKLMHPALVAGEDMVDRFILEARTAAGLSHPNIVPIYAVKVQEDLLYFVMKFVEGRALDSIIKAEAPLDTDTVRHIVAQVADALGYAHRRGVIHRDIKPANIIISTDGHPILADFGIAKVADRPGLTLTGATIGTPTYMSPEQCDAQPVTGASDQYSLGVTAFEMLTGKPPFDAPSYLTLMLKQATEPAPSVQEKVATCPTDMATTIDRMLAKVPAERFATMEDVAESLSAGAVTSTHTVRTQLVEFALADPRRELLRRVSTPRSPIPTEARRTRVVSGSIPPQARRSIGPAVLGGLLVVAIVIGAMLLRQRSGGSGIGVADSVPAAIVARPPAESIAVAPAAVEAPAPVPASVPAPPVDRPAAPPVERAGPPVVGAVHITGPESLVAGSASVVQAEVRDSRGRVMAGKQVAWSSSAPDVVSVNSSGQLQGRAEGRAMITATIEGVSQFVTIVVSAEDVAAVSVSPGSLALTPGETATLTARVAGASGRVLDRPVEWHSSAPSVATVSRSGAVSAVGPGTASIRATSAGVSGAAGVTVTPPAATPEVTAADRPAPTDADRRAAIVATISAYARALEARNMSAVRQVYPTISTEQLERTLATMNDLQVQLTVKAIQLGETVSVADVTGAWTFSADGRRNTLPANNKYRVQQKNGAWVITDIQ